MAITPLDNGYTFCYTQNMKTAISIDKKLYDEAEGFSRSVGLSEVNYTVLQ